MSESSNPYRNFNFLVEIDDLVSAQFSEVSGLDLTTEVVEYRSGGQVGVSKLPGRHNVGDITLKRGVTQNREIWDWYDRIRKGDMKRRDLAILILDGAFEPQLRWEVRAAWPRRYVGPLLMADGNDIAIEELVLVCDDISLAS